MRNNLIFGGINSSDFGVWISGSDTYSAAERDSEHFSVPGRNGDLIVDNGRYKNKLVTYPAFFPNKFPEKMENFRSAICRKIGYQRLEDSYHPDEYRMAEFVNGINPSDLTAFNRSGDFTLAFNCKPQRFLKSGDEPIQIIPPVTIANGMATLYMPVAGPLHYKMHCSAGETLVVEVQTYDANGTALRTGSYAAEDGDEVTFAFLATDKFFRIRVTDVQNYDTTWLEVITTISTGGEILPVNAIFARSWTIQNPTGYATEPMIECFANALPYTTITNYESGEEVDYYDFHSNQGPVSHFFMDCEMQYLYDENHQNLTQYLFLTTAQTAAGKGLVFPKLGTDEIKFEFYYAGASIEQGVGLIQIYPRWWII